jgi:hypothetical protein
MPETEFVVVIRIPNPEVPIFGGLIDVALRLPRKVNLLFRKNPCYMSGVRILLENCGGSLRWSVHHAESRGLVFRALIPVERRLAAVCSPPVEPARHPAGSADTGFACLRSRTEAGVKFLKT